MGNILFLPERRKTATPPEIVAAIQAVLDAAKDGRLASAVVCTVNAIGLPEVSLTGTMDYMDRQTMAAILRKTADDLTTLP
jgi:hypothetical protein